MISFVFFEVNQAVKEINKALNSNSEEALALALSNRAARLSGVVGENGSWYMKMLEEKRKIKQEVHFINFYLIRNCRQVQVLKDDFQSVLRSLSTLMFINILNGSLDGMQVDVIR